MPQPRSASGRGVAARAAASRLLRGVTVAGRPLDALLDSEASFRTLSARDRAFARALVATALRRHGQIAQALGHLLARPLPRKSGRLAQILAVAAAQILFLEVPAFAAVATAMEDAGSDRDAQHYKPLVNGVLRRLIDYREAFLAETDAARLNTPDWLWTSWVDAYGEAAVRTIAATHLIEPGLDLSVKSDAAGWADRLGGIVLSTGSVRLVPSGPVENLLGYSEGEWWVQDAAAALPARLLGDVRGKRVADLCAAPGGKTAALAHAGARVTAVDASSGRLERLAGNLRRLKLDAELVAADVLTWEPDAPFDAVLLDAPCTATGTIRRHPDIPLLKRQTDVGPLAALQAKMIDRATRLLKPGGTLVYCTCSLQPQEGETQITGAIERNGLRLSPVTAEEIGGLTGAVTAIGTVRTLPSQLPNPSPRLSGLDGFFIARLIKP